MLPGARLAGATLPGATLPGATLPGATLGLLGAGQLGRMFTIAAKRMGYHVRVLAPADQAPAAQVADEVVCADYADTDAVEELARRCAVVTLEFENIPAEAIDAAERHAPVRPGRQALLTSQHRLREKRFLSEAGLPVAPFAEIDDPGSLDAAVRLIGTPAVLKTAAFGYDGKGQTTVTSPGEAQDAWERIGRQPAVLEAFVDFRMEVSVVVARGLDSVAVTYGPIANDHANHILDVSRYPADLEPHVAEDARRIALAVAEQFGYVGVLCVEFFVTKEGEVLVNEIAPRPHNSGHLTIDTFVTCQFEQQVRAVCGLPLGSAEPLVGGAAMANLLGDLWHHGSAQRQPRWDRLLSDGSVKLHLYGKSEARPGRKMGHVTAGGRGAAAAVERVLAARRRLEEPMLSATTAADR